MTFKQCVEQIVALCQQPGDNRQAILTAAREILLKIESKGGGPAEKMTALLKLIGNVSECTGADCKRVVVWVQGKTGKMILDPDGTPHWATCPNAKDFRKKT